MKWPEYQTARSQDLETIYHDAGQFYFYKVSAFRASLATDAAAGGYAMKIIPFVLDPMEVQDIDHLADWNLAEMKYRMMKNIQVL